MHHRRIRRSEEAFTKRLGRHYTGERSKVLANAERFTTCVARELPVDTCHRHWTGVGKFPSSCEEPVGDRSEGDVAVGGVYASPRKLWR
jgi:hypothetical protein